MNSRFYVVLVVLPDDECSGKGQPAHNISGESLVEQWHYLCKCGGGGKKWVLGVLCGVGSATR